MPLSGSRATRSGFIAGGRRVKSMSDRARATSTLWLSRGAVGSAGARLALHCAPDSVTAPRASVAGCDAQLRRAALRHYRGSPKCWRYSNRGTRCALWRAHRSPQIRHCARAAPQSSCRGLGGQTRARCSRRTLSFSQRIPRTACGRVGAGFAGNWRSARRSCAPCALRMHPKADTTSHGWAPARGCDDLFHW